MADFVGRLWNRLSKKENDLIGKWCHENPSSAASICSGTNGYQQVFEAVSACVQERSGRVWDWSVVFACERHPAKQTFLKVLHRRRLRRLVSEATSTVAGAKALDAISGELQEVSVATW